MEDKYKVKSAKDFFGWKCAFDNYGLKNFFKDSVFPLTVSIFLCLILYVYDIDILFQLKFLLDVGFMIVPTMIALMLTAYTIILNFILGGKISSLLSKEAGCILVKKLNSSFAISLLVTIIFIILLVVVGNILHMNILFTYADIVNYITFFVISYLLLFSISVLIGVVVNVFNMGQIVFFNEK